MKMKDRRRLGRAVAAAVLACCWLLFPHGMFAQVVSPRAARLGPPTEEPLGGSSFPHYVPSKKEPFPTAPVPRKFGLTELIQLGLEHNPALAQAGLDVEALRGRAIQAGLYPNPVVSVIGDELGDRQGPGGINTLPLITQEIVLGGKLRLNRGVAGKEVDQANLALVRQRFVLMTSVRQGYFEVLAGQRRVEVLGELVGLAGKSLDNAKKLLGAGEAAKPDVFQFEIELDRLVADKAAAQRDLAAAWGRLFHNLRGSLETELAQDHPVHVVAQWLGNTPKVAAAHYLQVRDSDFDRALAGGAKSGALKAQKAAPRTDAGNGDDSHDVQETLENPRRECVFAGNAGETEYPRQESNL